MSSPTKPALGARLVPRFPDRWQNRRGYCRVVQGVALIATGCAGFAAIWLLGLSWLSGMLVWLAFVVVGTRVPTAAAYRLWPTGHRTGMAMAWRGVLVVASAFVALSLVALTYFLVAEWLLCRASSQACRPSVGSSLADHVVFAFGYTFVLGTAFTLGLPWIAGVVLSAAFRSPPPEP